MIDIFVNLLKKHHTKYNVRINLSKFYTARTINMNILLGPLVLYIYCIRAVLKKMAPTAIAV